MLQNFLINKLEKLLVKTDNIDIQYKIIVIIK